MSAALTVGPFGELFCPVKAADVFDPFTSPDWTSEFVDVFFASTDALPDDTTPLTCPPTASPLLPLPDWLLVARLSPFWTFVPLESDTSARAMPGASNAPTANTATAAKNL